MKAKIVIFFAVSVFSASAQSTFQNLDFELANPGPLTQGPYGPYAINVPVANALPDWSVYYGNTQQSTIDVNSPSLGSTAVNLYTDGFGPPIDGDDSVLLQGGVINGVPTPASISQTGTISGTSESLLFKVQSAQPPIVSIGSQQISLVALGSGSDYTLYGGDISAFSGQTEQITFSTSGFGSWLIDDISFSPNAVPEPSPFILTGIGGLFFAARRWCWKR